MLEPVAEAPARLREGLAPVLAGWGLDPDGAGDAAIMIASELVSNAVEHARTSARVTVERGPDRVRIEVRDRSPLPLRMRRHNPYAARGRGLQVVDRLAVRWSWYADADGKTVWAEVPCGADRPSGGAAAP